LFDAQSTLERQNTTLEKLMAQLRRFLPTQQPAQPAPRVAAEPARQVPGITVEDEEGFLAKLKGDDKDGEDLESSRMSDGEIDDLLAKTPVKKGDGTYKFESPRPQEKKGQAR
jgi:hypothetical protein